MFLSAHQRGEARAGPRWQTYSPCYGIAVPVLVRIYSSVMLVIWTGTIGAPSLAEFERAGSTP